MIQGEIKEKWLARGGGRILLEKIVRVKTKLQKLKLKSRLLFFFHVSVAAAAAQGYVVQSWDVPYA